MENRLEGLRKDNNITQEDLTKVLGVLRQTISSIENGKYNPSLELAFKISIYFKMSIEEIFIYEGDEDE